MTHIIKNPRITEKASTLMEGNAYVFDVMPSATKPEIKKAIFAIYKVHPVKINMLSVKSKEIIVRGKKGVRSGGKKAVVYLKEGDKIEFI